MKPRLKAAFVLCGLRLKAFSRITVVINALFTKNRTRMVRNDSINKYQFEDDFCDNIFTKCQNRPVQFEKFC